MHPSPRPSLPPRPPHNHYEWTGGDTSSQPPYQSTSPPAALVTQPTSVSVQLTPLLHDDDRLYLQQQQVPDTVPLANSHTDITDKNDERTSVNSHSATAAATVSFTNNMTNTITVVQQQPHHQPSTTQPQVHSGVAGAAVLSSAHATQQQRRHHQPIVVAAAIAEYEAQYRATHTATLQPNASPYIPLKPGDPLGLDDPPIPHGLGRIQTVGEWADCGFPCWNDSNERLDCEAAPIPELRGIYSPMEWNIFAFKIRKIFSVNSTPVFPMGVFCIFFLPCIIHYRNALKLAIRSLIDEENVKLSEIGLKWILKAEFGTDFILTMVWIPGVRESYEAAHPDQRQITKEPYPEQLLSPMEKGRRAAIKVEEDKQQQARAMEEQKQLQLAQLKLLQSLVAQGQLSAAQISALGLNSNGSSGGPPIYGIEPSAPPPYLPIMQADFCSSCGASRVGATGPFCQKCGHKAS